jgi:hypothetical protein
VLTAIRSMSSGSAVTTGIILRPRLNGNFLPEIGHNCWKRDR